MLLIAFQFFGLYGGILQPIRVLVLLFAPFLIVRSVESTVFKSYSYERLFFVLFFLFGLISFFYAIDLVSVLKGVFYIVVNSLLFLTIVFVSWNCLNPKLSIVYGWILFFILSVPIAFLEIFKNYHLSLSVIEDGTVIGGIGELQVYAAVTFGNYNLFNVLLVFVFPFLTANVMIQKNIYIRLFTIFLVLSLCFVLITNASRGGFLCIILGIIYFVIKYFGLFSSHRKYAILFLVGILSVTIKYSNSLFFMIFYRLDSLGLNDTTRFDIIIEGLKVLLDYYFFGVGSQNFQNLMQKNSTLDITTPHNLFLELLVEYGLIVFVSFLFLLYKIYSNSKKADIISNYIVSLGLLTFPIVSFINSTYISGVNMWVFLASLAVIADNRFLKLKLSNGK
jgi:O-antigen ligase